MQYAKISLSPQQIKLVTDAEWILTKNDILHRIKAAFGVLYKEQEDIVKAASLPAEVLKAGGKISRGENYLGLPWIVLDNPRCFTRQHIFAVRTMFWWGKYFSTTLHVSGKWQQQFQSKLLKAYSMLQQHHFTLCHTGDEWVHDVTGTAYTPISQILQKEFEKILTEAPFIKIAAYTGIENIETATEILMEQFTILMNSVEG